MRNMAYLGKLKIPAINADGLAPSALCRRHSGLPGKTLQGMIKHELHSFIDAHVRGIQQH